MNRANSAMEQARTLLSDLDEPTPLTPRQFCRLMLGISGMPFEEIISAETESGHKKRCVQLLAKATNRSKKTVRSWGTGLDFSGMPKDLQIVLGTYWERHQLHTTLKELILAQFVRSTL